MPVFLAARLSEHPSMVESLRFQVTGFAIVVCALVLLWLLLSLVGMLFKSRAAAGSKVGRLKSAGLPSMVSQPVGLPTAVPAARGRNGEHPSDELAVIVASVAATVRVPHRIVSVHEVTPLPPEMLAVIAATIHTMVQAPHRIVSARRVVATSPTAWYPSAWSTEGRREIFVSHHVR